MSSNQENNGDLEEDAKQFAKEVQGKAEHNPDTGASQHFCPVHGWYSATSTAHEGH